MHMLLVLVMAMSSPAWCACMWARSSEAAVSRATTIVMHDACCGDQPPADDAQPLPCGDEDADCACCNAIIAASNGREVAAGAAAVFDVFIALPAPLTSMLQPARASLASTVASVRSGAPPTLYAQRSQLLI
jgi:hypothetical protein